MVVVVIEIFVVEAHVNVVDAIAEYIT